MPALDAIASFQTTVGSTFAAGVMASGDSATIRNFPATASAKLLEVMYDDVTAPAAFRIRSALLHDNVRGLEFTPGASAPAKLLPSWGLQALEAQDSLIFELSTAATTGKAVAVCSIYYPQLPGAAARLYAPGDVLGDIANIKPLYVAIGSGANTAGTWYDLVLTTTESILHANTDYAVLGISFDQAVAAIGVKGADTGNLRCCVPGGANNPYGADYFVRKSIETSLPLIPVINSANLGGSFVSIMSSAATGAAGTAQLILAELNNNLA
jgi:hypothetical protein